MADIPLVIRALVKFDISKNKLFAPGAKALSEGLKGNQVMTELNISDNYMGYGSANLKDVDMSGVMDIANAIPTMGAMKTVTVNTFALPIQDIKTKSKLDFSGKGLRVEDAIIIAALIPLNVSRTTRFSCCYLLILLLYHRQGGVRGFGYQQQWTNKGHSQTSWAYFDR